ncbi:MAG TPA: NADH-ubiquinone oxidoreductase-F iron-sulfur binding region domain-containing protein, partial [Thermoanaerobaculia bacterium]|nr:NADH-ubiquinone oxidoreductase-F iron-sulfur binding region domain-containing protein [Thermoanaerobaculia bacterium]
TEWMRLILERIESGRGSEGDLDLLARVVPNVGGISLCALGDAAQGPVKSLVQKFGDEIRDNIRNRRYPLPRIPFFALGAVA